MTSIRHDNLKYGFYANLEQQVAKDVGVFARASWNDGQNEILSFTDIDRSALGRRVDQGQLLGAARPTPSASAAPSMACPAPIAISSPPAALGLLIGDGRLNYSNERILEAYYAFALNKNFTLTADYQLIANPAYNADRGPVSIFSGRLHGEF